MVRYYVTIFVYALVYSVICEEQDGVFIVYPFKEGDINQSKAKFSVRKFESEIRRKPKMLVDTNLHLIYPSNENIFIMTPAPMPMQESDNIFLETTTMTESSTDIFSDITTETDSTYTQSGDVDLRSMKESVGGTTAADDIVSTTIDFVTTEIPIQYTQKLPDPEPSLVDIIYEDTGPKKILRKRMFEAIKFSRKYPSGLKMNNDMKIPTTKSPANAFKNWYTKTTGNKSKKILEKLSTKKIFLKKSNDNFTTEKESSENVQRRRRRYNVIVNSNK